MIGLTKSQKERNEKISNEVEEFLANGGKIKQLESGVWSSNYAKIKFCRCGCSGNQERHKEIALEEGRNPELIIRITGSGRHEC